MSKPKKAIIILLCIILVSPIIGLIVTGYTIGWGPFATLRYYNKSCYDINGQNLGYKLIEKNINGKNGNIKGYLFLSGNEVDNQQIVILSHGLATEMWHNINTAASLANAGISVFMFDYCGGSIHSKSDMKTTEMSILTEKQDLNDVIDEIKTWDFVDKNKIGIIGYSQGGLVAAMVAAERNDIYQLCLQYPAFTMYDEIKKTYSSVDDIPNTIDRNGMLTGKVYYADIVTFEANDIYAYCAQYENEVLLIHGTADLLVDYNSSVKAVEYYKNATLLTIENGGHGFVGEDDLTSVKAEYDFFTK